MRYIILFLSIICFISCQRNDPNDTVDLIHVVREGASIPAYIYGNTNSETFLIILHGGPGGNGLEYKLGEFSDRLENDYAVVYTDQRGQGMSQSSANAPVNSLELMTEDVYSLALTLREKYGQDINLFLMGHSWGGLLGTSVMINDLFSQEFKGWIEVAGAHSFPQAYIQGHEHIDSICTDMIVNQISTSTYLSFQERLEDVNINEVTLDNFSVTNALAFEVEAQLLTDGITLTGDAENLLDYLKYQYFVNNYLTSLTSGSATNGNLFANDLFSVDLTSQLKNITTPTLLLWGAYDMVVAPELGRQAFDEIEIEEKEFFLFLQSGHSPMDNETQLFTDKVIEFIETYK